MTTPEFDGGSDDTAEDGRPNLSAYSPANRFAVARAFPRKLFRVDLDRSGAITDTLVPNASAPGFLGRLTESAQRAWQAAKVARDDGDESTATFYRTLAHNRAQRVAQMREQIRGWRIRFD